MTTNKGKQMSTILGELSKPFHPAHVTWKPGAVTKDGAKALGMAYADLRAYQNRLDEVCGMGWGVSYSPWGDRIVCHLTIEGVTRSSTGEGDAQSEKSEIAGTASEAQAFKRACAMFGLGRYLYNLPSVWAEYDKQRRQFTEAGKARLNGIIVEHYRRNVDEAEKPPAKAQPQRKPPPRQSAPPAGPVSQEEVPPTAIDGSDSAAEFGDIPSVERKTPKAANPQGKLHAEISNTFGGLDTDAARHWIIERWTTKETPDNVRTSANDLTPAEIEQIVDGLKQYRVILRNQFVNQKVAA